MCCGVQGKSTITKMLLRLYQPSAGLVLLDGQDISRFDTSGLFAWCDQDCVCFNDTIKACGSGVMVEDFFVDGLGFRV